MKFELGRLEKDVNRRVEQLVAERAAERIWQRDVDFWRGDAERKRSVGNRLGWLDVASQMRERVPELQRFAQELRADAIESCVLLGMGGSSLAPEVLRQTLPRRDSAAPALHVLDTTHPATILSVALRLNPARTLFFLSSKSGTTLEPNCLFAYFWKVVQDAGIADPGRHFVAVTDARTPLQDVAREHSFRRVFTNSGDIGGRYSALSYFGLAPAAACGMNHARLLERGIGAANAAKAPDSEALRLGTALGELARRGRDKCTFVVSPPVAAFGLWVEQLIAESTGKLGRGILPVAGEPMGTPRRYGDDRVFVQLRLAGDASGELDALTGALYGEGQPVIVIDLDDAYDLGRQFFTWEFAIAVAGRVLEINPFDEPNVQESKDNTNRVLAGFESSGRLDVEGLDAQAEVLAVTSLDTAPQRDIDRAVVELLSSIAPGDYFAITAYIEPTERAERAFSEIRGAIRDAYSVATTLGYGPRFLHSTGQLHKGGPPLGVFLQVTQTDREDIPVPGKPYTFGQLKRAQAIGDLQSLLRRGRPVLRAHIGGDADAGVERLRAAVKSAVGAGGRAGR